MVFSTIIFLFRFLPITLALYYLAPAKLKNTVLFLCSLVFYCWGEVRFFPVMVALILINYLSGLAIEHFDAKPRCAAFFCWWRSLAAWGCCSTSNTQTLCCAA